MFTDERANLKSHQLASSAANVASSMCSFWQSGGQDVPDFHKISEDQRISSILGCVSDVLLHLKKEKKKKKENQVKASVASRPLSLTFSATNTPPRPAPILQ